ncbi:hypothetical protein IAT38_007932 [Cryptococcus sp. DSM 104549]
MVFGIIAATAVCPAIVATKQTIEQGQKGNRNAGNKSHRLGLVVRFPGGHPYREKFQDAQVVMKDNKLYVNHADTPPSSPRLPLFAGSFNTYPEFALEWARVGHKGDSLITSVADDERLYRVYVDADTHEVKYALSEEAEQHYPGPWECTTGSHHRLTFEGWEGFVVVQENEEKDEWALYFDHGDDGLSGEGQVGDTDSTGERRRMLAVHVGRVELPKTHARALEERQASAARARAKRVEGKVDI